MNNAFFGGLLFLKFDLDKYVDKTILFDVHQLKNKEMKLNIINNFAKIFLHLKNEMKGVKLC